MQDVESGEETGETLARPESLRLPATAGSKRERPLQPNRQRVASFRGEHDGHEMTLAVSGARMQRGPFAKRTKESSP